MLKVGDKFSARARGSNHRVGLDYRKDDLFEVTYVGVYNDGCTLKHLKSGIEFKENQYRLDTDFKKHIENADQRFIIDHLAGVDEMTLGAIKLLVEESIGKPKKEITVAELGQKVDAQTDVLAEIVQLMKEQQFDFDNKIKMIKYRAHLHGLTL